VSTADGDRRIDEIEAGDYVWSYDTECDEKVLAKVTNVSVTETDVLVHVITSEGDDIRTTMFHPFYVKSTVEENGNRYNGEWKAASNLIVGDELLTDDGRVIYVEEVRIERLAKNIAVYNLEIGVWHTYFVDDRVLVHNLCKEDIVKELKSAKVIYKKNPVTGNMEPYMKQIIVDDGYRIILRRDVGDFSHELADHWNLEIQTPSGNTKYDMHMFVDELSNIIKIEDKIIK